MGEKVSIGFEFVWGGTGTNDGVVAGDVEQAAKSVMRVLGLGRESLMSDKAGSSQWANL